MAQGGEWGGVGRKKECPQPLEGGRGPRRPEGREGRREEAQRLRPGVEAEREARPRPSTQGRWSTLYCSERKNAALTRHPSASSLPSHRHPITSVPTPGVGVEQALEKLPYPNASASAAFTEKEDGRGVCVGGRCIHIGDVWGGALNPWL